MRKLTLAVVVVFTLSMCMSSTTFATNQDQESIVVKSQEAMAKQIVEQLKSEMIRSQKSDAFVVKDNIQKEKDLALLKEYQAYAVQSVKYDAMGSVASDVGLITNKELINQFTEYATEKGLIDKSVSASSVSKSIARGFIQTAASAAGALGYKLAGELLSHSLQDNPSDLSFDRGTSESNIVKKSTVREQVISDIKMTLHYTSGDYYSTSGSFTLNDTTDLHLAINRCDYIVGAERVNGTWNIYMRTSDLYDFNYSAWSNVSGFSQAIVTIINNYAANAQSTGVIVPYNDCFYTLDTY